MKQLKRVLCLYLVLVMITPQAFALPIGPGGGQNVGGGYSNSTGYGINDNQGLVLGIQVMSGDGNSSSAFYLLIS